MILFAGVAGGRYVLSPAAPPGMPDFAFDVAVPGTLTEAGSLALSPDGSHLAFRARAADGSSEIWIRALGQTDARPLPGTRDRRNTKPAWSPDGRHLAFFVGQEIFRVALDGGAPQRIGAAPLLPQGAAWSRDDVLLFGTIGGAIFRIDARGGSQPVAVTTVDSPSEDMHVWPEFLPDGKRFVFLADASTTDAHRIRLASIDGGGSPILLQGIISSPAVDPRGALLVVQRAQLMSYPFDFRRGTVGREPQPVVDGVVSVGEQHGMTAAIAAHGILAYQRGIRGGDLVRMTLDGTVLGVVASAERFANPAASPDGRQIAFDVPASDFAGRMVWQLDLERGVRTLISERGVRADTAAWSAAGETLYFASNPSGVWKVYRKAIAGAGAPEEIGAPPDARDLSVLDCSDDGKYLLVQANQQPVNWNLYLLPLDAPGGQWIPWLTTPASEDTGRFSPDSRWIVYTSTASGGPEVYVSAVADSSRRWQISAGGGLDPAWSADGKRVLYRSPTDQLMSAEVDFTSGEARAGAPRVLFELGAVPEFTLLRRVFAVMPDGKSLVIVRGIANQDVTIHVRSGIRRHP